MPRSLAWFNQRLEQTIFPTIAALFPEIAPRQASHAPPRCQHPRLSTGQPQAAASSATAASLAWGALCPPPSPQEAEEPDRLPVCAALASLPPEPRRHAPPCTVQVSGPSVLRAHSVAILKYNASHPRTDVHVDDGVLAMTLALSPRANYSGGGTCPAPPHPP
jgi:hypothetical protein